MKFLGWNWPMQNFRSHLIIIIIFDMLLSKMQWKSERTSKFHELNKYQIALRPIINWDWLARTHMHINHLLYCLFATKSKFLVILCFSVRCDAYENDSSQRTNNIRHNEIWRSLYRKRIYLMASVWRPSDHHDSNSISISQIFVYGYYAHQCYC